MNYTIKELMDIFDIKNSTTMKNLLKKNNINHFYEKIDYKTMPRILVKEEDIKNFIEKYQKQKKKLEKWISLSDLENTLKMNRRTILQIARDKVKYFKKFTEKRKQLFIPKSDIVFLKNYQPKFSSVTEAAKKLGLQRTQLVKVLNENNIKIHNSRYIKGFPCKKYRFVLNSDIELLIKQVFKKYNKINYLLDANT